MNIQASKFNSDSLCLLGATMLLAFCSFKAGAQAVTGIVLDAQTKAPMSGVFILGEYVETGHVGFVHSASTCVETRASYSGPDGRYSLPVIDGIKPKIHAIALDYFDDILKRPTEIKTTWFGQAKRVMSPEILMSKREKGYEIEGSYILCGQPKDAAALSANIEYLKIYKNAYAKFATGPILDSIGNSIALLESMAVARKGK